MPGGRAFRDYALQRSAHGLGHLGSENTLRFGFECHIDLIGSAGGEFQPLEIDGGSRSP
jgi:hypothetical protein